MMKTRREFFNSFIHRKGEEVVIRPPYYKDISLFESECLTCKGVCKEYCPEEIIVIQDDKLPKLDFGNGGCTYCDECAKACEFGVLEINNRRLINAKVTIDITKCLSWNKTMCFSCKDICLDDAVKFLALFRAEIDYEKCTNCGFCVSACPVRAISVKGVVDGS